MFYNRLFLLLPLLFAVVSIQANVTLPSVIGNNMVLQRNETIIIWGWANPGENITLKSSWLEESIQTVTNNNGKWELQLKTKNAGGPYQIEIQGENKITLTDVYFGEVWLCSGQSNMEKPIGLKDGQRPVFNYEEEIKNANYPLIRLFHVPRKKIANIQTDIDSKWEICTPQSVDSIKFSAVAYFFGRKLFSELNVPIGLIDASWGGTRIEPWTPVSGLQKIASLDSIYQIAQNVNDEMDKINPTLLYNGMIAPLTMFKIKGCIWYQGESNLLDLNDGLFYEEKMKALIYGWRKEWKNNELPFYFVQIAPHSYLKTRSNRVKSPNELPLIWEAQSNALKIPQTGMVVTTDLVDDLNDIHPRNKQDVGLRLALQALAKTYNKEIVCDGPSFKKIKIKNNKAIISFERETGNLMSPNPNDLSFFTIAGKDGNFSPAKASIVKNKVVVYNSNIKKPKAVRFAWHEEAQPNLFNSAGLPAQPFRTDK